ncbi:hypothetical protein WJX81_006638 [Elliptochloris bilobata]|uniref:Uncharacterized protein n=1 Tax=Elliptochloris bilobata TaxID=381761 RepID=A0AAW1RWS4_9CHLO
MVQLREADDQRGADQTTPGCEGYERLVGEDDETECCHCGEGSDAQDTLAGADEQRGIGACHSAHAPKENGARITNSLAAPASCAAGGNEDAWIAFPNGTPVAGVN